MLNNIIMWFAGWTLRHKKVHVSWYVSFIDNDNYQTMYITSVSRYAWLATAKMRYWLMVLGQALGDSRFTISRAAVSPDPIHFMDYTILNGLYIVYLDSESILESSYEVPHQNLN